MLLSIVVLLLAACGGNQGEVQGPADAAAVAQPTDLQMAVVTDDFGVGTPRVPFVLYDGPEPAEDVEAVQLTAFDLDTKPPTATWQGQALNFSDYEVPYWVAYPEVPEAGFWGFQAQITRADGTQTMAQFTIEVKERSQSPAVGEAAPPSENRTLADGVAISALTSGQDPIPALYEQTVAEALAADKPLVVTLATPAFCQTRICAPVVRSVETVFQKYDGEANFIHLEIYKDFESLTPADEVEEWRLTSEPWTFVVDAEGRVAARLGGPVSARELEAALTPLLP
ncbi:MAG: hypothetical protein R3300_04475 [Candidatus Promineifilaceae bacterium]|nr:hypothetical protein [Candidatus Promineifilaceae bacterium]